MARLLHVDADSGFGRQNVLPASLAPRGLSRVQASAYVGVGVTKFDQMVADHRMPPPKAVDGRLVWDRLKLDEAFEALPERGEAGQHAPEDVWDDVRL
jgi:hypothetical protein